MCSDSEINNYENKNDNFLLKFIFSLLSPLNFFEKAFIPTSRPKAPENQPPIIGEKPLKINLSYNRSSENGVLPV
jgi:hypothetical protein